MSKRQREWWRVLFGAVIWPHQRRRFTWRAVLAVLAWPWVATEKLRREIYRSKYRRR